jgi:hypothetical protein
MDNMGAFPLRIPRQAESISREVKLGLGAAVGM